MTARVLVNARCLGNDAGFRGVGSYTRQLLRFLPDQPGISVEALVLPGTSLPEGVEGTVVQQRAPGRLAPLERDLRLPFELRRVGHDIFHEPTPDPPLHASGPWVQTLHDVIPLVYPDPALAAERRRWRVLGHRYRRASRVIAVSRYTADEAIRLLDLDAARVVVSHHGVDPVFVPDGTEPDDDPPYLLMVGEYSLRKGYREAFEVIAALADRGYPHRLKIGGRIAPWIAPAVTAAVESALRPDRIDVLGFVHDLPGTYRRADLFLCPSRYEGFGLPVLEAMASGVPIVAFANSAIPEVVGDGGLLVPDGDISAMVDAVQSLLDERSRREDLRSRGLQRASHFSWERCAAVHADVYRSVAG
jgi:glycosyltransferase involved in cell wall biosynthesis